MSYLKSFIVAGTPGAGKTTLLSRLKEAKLNVKIVNMGSEMLKYATLSDRDKLRYMGIEEQKKLRGKAINELSKEHGTILIDTHLSVKQGNTYLPGFSIKELKKLNVKGFLYIDATAEEIIKRRGRDKSRKREKESKEEIDTQRSINLGIMSAAAAELNIPIYIFRNEEGKVEQASKELEEKVRELIA